MQKRTADSPAKAGLFCIPVAVHPAVAVQKMNQKKITGPAVQ